ncbi:MvdC/MvdD family ATP grasp protein [Robertkochia solimangrovi]|uniref:MvdC/MvdD family ATP grasp protein n=1 Tax=Robertkochia solimangrovi TaxID=2213046 RepID=UPI001180DA58|nr:alpha-L-glutamate ligase [Robertkochia solimangrovi]TRZ42554.1 alpha-L-glutamate ligase [Robertkochia solimangrovi]
MILTVSFPEEEHTEKVHEILFRKGKEFVLFDLSQFPSSTGFGLRISDDTEESTLLINNRAIHCETIKAGWWRRVRPFTINGSNPQDNAFIQSEASQAIDGLLDKLQCPWINPRKDDEIAHRKIYQWSVARRIGLNLPRTLVTNDPMKARAFIRDLGIGNVVYKAFLASINDWRETRILKETDLQFIENVSIAPVIFQEYIEGVDLRITVVGDKIFPVSIDARKTSYPADMRMVVGESVVGIEALPKEIEKKIFLLQKTLNLAYGAIDMRRTNDGKYVFFEVNPAGQWLFAEQHTGLPITEAVANLLIERSNGIH